MLRNARNRISLALVICIIMSLFPVGVLAAAPAPQAKNVIILIPDGMTTTCTTLARWYTGKKLALDEILVGGAMTFSADSLITDSAPAATAMSSGNKSDTGYIAVSPSKVVVPGTRTVTEEDAFVPYATVLEAAKLEGKATGVIATSQIQHATPAGYTSHNYNRNDYEDIAEQQVYLGMDVVFGGGKDYLLPGVNNTNNRNDGEDLVQALKDKGYTFVDNRNDFLALDANAAKKVWGAFAPVDLAYDFDRKSDQPSLAEMTKKAIDILSKDNDGFFLMVEGSKIDWAAHANDPVGVVSDTIAFDNAVRVALDFAKKDRNTLIISVTDHGCGGLTIGNENTTKGYDTLQLSAIMDTLKKAKSTEEGINKLLFADRANLKDVLKYNYGISDPTEEEIKTIMGTKGNLSRVLGPMLSKRSALGWTTGGHTGEDVFLYAYGPGKPSGLIDNTDVAKYAAAALGLDLAKAQKQLFMDITAALSDVEGVDAELNVDDAANPVLVITKGAGKVEMPVSKNLIIVNGKTTEMGGLTILSKNGTVYVPQQAIDIIKNLK